MANINSYSEAVADLSPSIASFTVESGQANMPLYLLGQDNGNSLAFDDLLFVPSQILGYNNSASPPGAYRMSRYLPYQHPVWQTMFAKRVGNVRGIGRPVKTPTPETTNTAEGVLQMPYFALYPNYQFDVDFQVFNYAVLPDTDIEVVKDSVWDPPPPQAAIPLVYIYAKEWQRYTEFDLSPQNDNVTGIAGQSKFVTGIPQAPGTAAGATFPAMPKMFLPNSIIKINWYNIPVRYMLSQGSYLNFFRGRVNQNPWYEAPNGGFMFQPGELLYLSYSPLKIYTSPFYETMPWGGGNNVWSKFMDVQLQFLFTRRVVGSEGLPEVSNPNFIAAGHNLNPFFPQRAYYYTVYATGNMSKQPFWYSFPVELLFTDPDSPQPEGVLF